MAFIWKRKTAERPAFTRVTAAAGHAAEDGFRLAPTPQTFEEGLYECLRENVPVIDAAITKLVRLTGGFAFKKLLVREHQVAVDL